MSYREIFFEIKEEYDEMIFNSKMNTKFIKKMFKNIKKYRNKYIVILKKYNKAKRILNELNIDIDIDIDMDSDSDENDSHKINYIDIFDNIFDKYLVKEPECNIKMNITKNIKVSTQCNNLCVN